MTYGSVQTGHHHWAVQDLVVSAHSPLLMDLGDFSREYQVGSTLKVGAKIFTISPLSSEVITATHWTKGLNNSFFTGQNSDIVDGGKYKPLSGKYTFKISCSGNLITTRVTIHTFVMRPSNMHPATSNVQTRSMPQALKNLTEMADPTVNTFQNNKFIKLYSSKTIIFQPHKYQDHFSMGAAAGASQHDGPTIEKLHYLNVYPKKVREQEYTIPIDAQDPTSEIPDSDFGHLNVPEGVPYWCLISCDHPTRNEGHTDSTNHLHHNSDASQQVRITASRVVTWRDHIGAA